MGNKSSTHKNPPVSGTGHKGQQNVNKSSGSKQSGTQQVRRPK